MEQKFIEVRGAREHNLKGVDMDIPRDSLVVITDPVAGVEVGYVGELLPAVAADADLPGRVTSLDSSGGAVRVSVGGPGGSERLTLGAPSGDTLPVEERVVFAPDPAVTGWLARFADALPEGDVTRARGMRISMDEQVT